GRVRGGFESAGHSVSWDLRYEPSPQPHYYFGDVLRRLSARRTSVTLPNPQIFLSGDVTIDGRPIHVARGPGHQAHHWGVERAPRWLATPVMRLTPRAARHMDRPAVDRHVAGEEDLRIRQRDRG